MSDETIRVGVIGAGANTTSRHIPGLQAIEGVEIASVCNRSRESGQRVAEQFNIPKVYDRWIDVINDPGVNAICIGTWPYMHARLTIAALNNGKHVLCEARMAMNAAEAHAMLAAAQAHPYLTAQIVPSPMTLGVDKTIRRLLAEGYLGDVLAVEVRAGGTFLDMDAPLHWRHDFDLSGFNTMTMGIWYEAVMRWIGHATAVTAMGKTYVKMRRGADGHLKAVRIPEHIDVLADMACGAQLHMQISGVTGLAGGPEVYLFGSRGTLRFSDNKLYGGQRNDHELREIPIPENERGGWRVEEEFINAIRGREPVTHTSFEDGVKYMEFTEAAIRSIAERRTIPLPL
ncbi:MAG TPA: Gfo/Idh/MocA family oxidoreductase [Caldilineaceae bacterium]|nr:Gfo/Idh/MocA family oxidoreductase [Caldilineaceae bacterium]